MKMKFPKELAETHRNLLNQRTGCDPGLIKLFKFDWESLTNNIIKKKVLFKNKMKKACEKRALIIQKKRNYMR